MPPFPASDLDTIRPILKNANVVLTTGRGRVLIGISGPAEEMTRSPMPVLTEDLEKADWIVALKQTEHLPLVQERFPDWTEKNEFWQVDDDPEALVLIEREVMDLVARLMKGGKQREVPTQKTTIEEILPFAKKEVLKTNAFVVRLSRETKGRRGKAVTTVSDIPLDEAGLLELAATFKRRCGTGGTVRDGRIEIQGDQPSGTRSCVQPGMGGGYQRGDSHVHCREQAVDSSGLAKAR
jgi:predicted translation initiation factor SUI1